MRPLTLTACAILSVACSSSKPAREPYLAQEPSRSSSETTVTISPNNAISRPPTESERPQFSAESGATAPADVRTSQAAPTWGAHDTMPRVPPAPDGASVASPSVAPIAQHDSKTDLKLTRDIRKAVMADASLSWVAKSVKIVTVNGKVTLLGRVKSDRERATVAASARRIAGRPNVDDRLEVRE